MPYSAGTQQKYGAVWDARLSDAQIELACIRMGGRWKNRRGKVCGLGLVQHMLNAQALIWPELDDHRWHRECVKAACENPFAVFMGPASCGKTHEAAKIALCDYFAAPHETMVLVSSTDLRGLELRVWGEIKMLWRKAKERHDWIPGNIVESKHCISTDDIDEDEVRDMRRGLIVIPCVIGGRFIGLQKYVGIKQSRVRLVADEAQFCPSSFLEAISNLEKNPDFRCIVMGNPLDTMDSLGKAAEPLDGWDSVGEPEKTTTWRTKFRNGVCLNLVGTDSPNFDEPGRAPKYPYLIHRKSIESTVEYYGMDSIQYYSQCKGVLKSGLQARRVITREICRKNGALEKAVWKGTPTTMIAAADIAYGNIGGDRAVFMRGEFGHDVSGKLVLELSEPEIIPVSIRNESSPEDQIAEFVRTQCEHYGIPPENFFYDATGRGSMGTAFARIWSAMVVPVEFGGAPSNRPVCQDMFILDPVTGSRRLKLCHEHYSKRVTQFWFTLRYCIESGQLRGLHPDVMDEGCMREWKIVRGDKIELESKSETKKRMGRSPDLMDCAVTVVEGACQRGFKIQRMGNAQPQQLSRDWVDQLRERAARILRSHELQY